MGVTRHAYAPLWVDLTGTANTRDVGGIPTPAGAVNAGVLIRSDNLQDLTAADVDRLRELGLTQVIDLRTPGEVAAEGPTPLQAAGIPHTVLSFVPDPDAAARGDGRILPDRRGQDPLSAYVGYLREMPDSVVDAVRLIARAPGASVVHCAAGKDRTGTLVALVLDAVGADREAVIADYLATADVIGPLMARLTGTPTYAPDLRDVDLDRHIPKDRTMRLLLEQLDGSWGGSAGWLTAHGLSGEDLEALRARLLP